ncbi:MAG: septum site-determining protein MinC [Chloroflexi bacterium]|nr:septum site-determining protein MinC [Chloroflexota bacterium]
MSGAIQFKGIRQGLLVTIPPDDEWAKVIADLATRIDQQAAFFKGASVALDVDKRAVRRHELANLLTILQKRDVNLISVLSTSATTQGAARKLGLATELVEPPATQSHIPDTSRFVETNSEAPSLKSDVHGTEGVLIRRTLRSGQSVQNNGHVVILGDVNAGSEIVAGGDVVVWGKLRGVVHAGAYGDETCVVCALDLQPTQLRIASLISVSPPSKKRRKHPERAYVEDGVIKAEPWTD